MCGDEMKHIGHPFKCVTRYENEDYYCCLREVDTIKEILSQFLEIIMGNSYQSSKNYGARIAYKGATLSPDDKIFPILSKKIDNIVMLIFKPPIKRNSKFPIKSIERSNKKRKVI